MQITIYENHKKNGIQKVSLKLFFNYMYDSKYSKSRIVFITCHNIQKKKVIKIMHKLILMIMR